MRVEEETKIRLRALTIFLGLVVLCAVYRLSAGLPSDPSNVRATATAANGQPLYSNELRQIAKSVVLITTNRAECSGTLIEKKSSHALIQGTDLTILTAWHCSDLTRDNRISIITSDLKSHDVVTMPMQTIPNSNGADTVELVFRSRDPISAPVATINPERIKSGEKVGIVSFTNLGGDKHVQIGGTAVSMGALNPLEQLRSVLVVDREINPNMVFRLQPLTLSIAWGGSGAPVVRLDGNNDVSGVFIRSDDRGHYSASHIR